MRASAVCWRPAFLHVCQPFLHSPIISGRSIPEALQQVTPAEQRFKATEKKQGKEYKNAQGQGGTKCQASSRLGWEELGSTF